MINLPATQQDSLLQMSEGRRNKTRSCDTGGVDPEPDEFSLVEYGSFFLLLSFKKTFPLRYSIGSIGILTIYFISRGLF